MCLNCESHIVRSEKFDEILNKGVKKNIQLNINKI